jgi:hypothetical protein
LTHFELRRTSRINSTATAFRFAAGAVDLELRDPADVGAADDSQCGPCLPLPAPKQSDPHGRRRAAAAAQLLRHLGRGAVRRRRQCLHGDRAPAGGPVGARPPRALTRLQVHVGRQARQHPDLHGTRQPQLLERSQESHCVSRIRFSPSCSI